MNALKYIVCAPAPVGVLFRLVWGPQKIIASFGQTALAIAGHRRDLFGDQNLDRAANLWERVPTFVLGEPVRNARIQNDRNGTKIIEIAPK